jgi:TolB protein
MMNRYPMASAVLVALVASLAAPTTQAQWENRYAKLDDFGHHIYLEQHELPILAHGPVDPAPSPDGRALAFAAQGWIWLMDLETGVATRVTDGPDVDSRPRWSPDGKRLALVRDRGSDTSIVLLEIEGGKEEVIDTPAIELDPEFSADGRALYYSSGESGSCRTDRACSTCTATAPIASCASVNSSPALTGSRMPKR